MNSPKLILTAALLGAWAIAGAGNLSVTSSAAPVNLALTGAGVPDTFVFSPTISVDTANYNLRAAAVSAGWNQVKPLTATVTIASGVVVSSASTGSYAFDTGSSFTTGTTLKLINNGFIVGKGGAGANGSTASPGAAGGAGGPALRVQYSMVIDNQGTVGGGGGGAGAGYGYNGYKGGAGGGGAGYGVGGTNGTYSAGNGGVTTGGAYGSATEANSSTGGNGGGLGQAGGKGGDYNGTWYSLAGGSPGAAVVGNGFITWATQGTRLGSIN